MNTKSPLQQIQDARNNFIASTIRQWGANLFGSRCPKEDSDLAQAIIGKGYELTIFVQNYTAVEVIKIFLAGKELYSANIPHWTRA